MKIKVLRLGHRIFRDQRITTHCALVARAFGADEIIYTGEKDTETEKSMNDVTKRWGGNFKIKYEKNYKKILKNWKGIICHLTMYGKNIDKIKIPKKDLLIIVGGEKVPSEVYQLSDYNIAIGNQPHSEVAALAIFLDKIHKGKQLKRQFRNAKLKIIPQEKGKKLLDRNIES